MNKQIKVYEKGDESAPLPNALGSHMITVGSTFVRVNRKTYRERKIDRSYTKKKRKKRMIMMIIKMRAQKAKLMSQVIFDNTFMNKYILKVLEVYGIDVDSGSDEENIKAAIKHKHEIREEIVARWSNIIMEIGRDILPDAKIMEEYVIDD